MINVKEIDHICLMVNDLNKFRKYYEKYFGFEFNLHPNNKDIWAVESKGIHFFVKEVSYPDEFVKSQHLSLLVDDIESVLKILKENNIKFNSGEFHEFKYKNYKWVEWLDSEGIRIECVERI